MQWTYTITAASRPKVLMRVTQVFDQQLLSLRALRLEDADGIITIRIDVSMPADLARRIQAKLYSQADTRNVELAAGTSPRITVSGGYRPDGDGWTHSDDVDDKPWSYKGDGPSTDIHPASIPASIPVTNEPVFEAG